METQNMNQGGICETRRKKIISKKNINRRDQNDKNGTPVKKNNGQGPTNEHAVNQVTSAFRPGSACKNKS